MKSTTTTTAQSGGNDVLQIEFEEEDNGRWIAEISALPGVMAYGATRKKKAQAEVEALARRMSQWRSTRSRRVLTGLNRNGWSIKRQAGYLGFPERTR